MAMIYAIGRQGYWTGASREIGDRDGMPRGWTRRPVPDLTPDEYAIWNGSGWNVTAVPPPGPVIAPADVRAERARRLALGFEYDFGDDRDIHRINTTPEDMAGWDEVTKAAQTALNLGQTDFEIAIKTGTGMVTVTAAEWQIVMFAAAQFRQPIYQADFALRAMSPIPADYTNDKWWPDA